jgi:hypothetical protein
VLLDLGDGSLRFFKNGAHHGPGYAAGSYCQTHSSPSKRFSGASS